MSLASFLPKPKGDSARTKPRLQQSNAFATSHSKAVTTKRSIPGYGSRGGYIPRCASDYGDGGAFPEIHRLQYPLGMGKKDASQSQSLAVVSVNEDGKADYSSIVKQDQRSGKNVFSDHRDLVPSHRSQEELSRPNKESQEKTTEKTRLALEKLVNGKISSSKPRQQASKAVGDPVYVRYAPSKMGINANSSEIEQRVIRVHEMPVDPMEPPKFVHKKAPQGPPSPPVPIMHSPPRKLTVQDQQNWRIPPCISNWKNLKGFTIAADKRLAADGRGLTETQINDKFAPLSEALYLAERSSRDELQTRSQMQKKLELKKREHKEEELRKLAQQAREKRSGLDRRIRSSDAYDETAVDEAAIDELEQREEIRRDIKRDARRETRMSHMGTQARKSKMDRDEQRDVSEQIALGKQVKGGGGDSLFDARLFNQSQGMSSGFGADDSYNAFDKPLFDKGGADRIYRPSKQADSDAYGGGDVESIIARSSGRFQPDRGFKGAETTTEQRQAGRSDPVQFERGTDDSLRNQSSSSSKDAADPFALDKFLTDAKRGKALDHIGRKGHMAASGGSGRADDYSGSHSKSIRFSEASSSSSSKRAREDDSRDSESRRRRR